jgi:hypothetical protein
MGPNAPQLMLLQLQALLNVWLVVLTGMLCATLASPLRQLLQLASVVTPWRMTTLLNLIWMCPNIPRWLVLKQAPPPGPPLPQRLLVALI